MIDQVLDGKYQVARLIGEGGMGAVYEATRREDDERVAVKVINDDAVAKDEVLVTRFEREALAASKILSPHIVEIFDAGHDPETGHPYMVMEMLDGENALQLINRLGPLPPPLAIRIGIQTCEGLARAHEAGVVHRDIKPANLFLADRGDEVVVKLLDFGVAKFKMDQASESQNQSLTRTGSMLGSPMYMSPEQARGLKTIDHRADIWSLGIVMYQLLVGKIPHEDIDGLGELIITICSEPPAPVNEVAPWVPAELAEVISGALQLASDQRYQSADEMAAALKGCLTGSTELTITKAMLVPLDEATKNREASPSSGGDQAGEHDQTVALDRAPNPGVASTVALSPEELEAAAAEDRGEPAPKATEASGGAAGKAEAGPPSVDAAQKQRDERALQKHREAQRAALDAARLSDEAGPSSGGRYVMMLVVVVVLGLGAWFAYMNLMADSGGSGPSGTDAPDTTSSPGSSE